MYNESAIKLPTLKNIIFFKKKKKCSKIKKGSTKSSIVFIFKRKKKYYFRCVSAIIHTTRMGLWCRAQKKNIRLPQNFKKKMKKSIYKIIFK